MTDDFLTSPDDLPALRACRRSPSPDDGTRTGNTDVTLGIDAREPGPAASVPSGAALAASVVLVVTMIALPAFGAVGAWSKTPGGPYRTL